MRNLLNFHIDNRDSFARVVFGYFLLLLLYRFHSSTFLAYQYGQPMKGPELDYAYWFSLCSGFPHYIIQHYWACLLVDIAVVLTAAACFISDKYRNVFCTLLLVFFFVQRITIETYACSHSKSMSPVFIALLPFCFKKEETFQLLAEFSRYFLMYVLIASAFYKFHNGALLDPSNFATVLVNQHSDLATLNPGHLCYKISSQLIAHPSFAAISFILLFLTQASFILGVFTQRYDRLLFIFLCIFAWLTYFIMRIYNLDITILGLYLLYFPAERISNKNKTTP